MRELIAACLLATVSFSHPSAGQPPGPRALQSGEVQLWAPTRITYGYELPAPVGNVDLTFTLGRRENPGPSERYLTLNSASVTYGDYGEVDLPGLLLSCLPSPRPAEADISTICIEQRAETDEDSSWFSRFTTYVRIPFGPLRPMVAGDDMDILVPGNLEFVITGDQVRRIAFIRASGERRALEYEGVIDSCPVDILDWMAE